MWIYYIHDKWLWHDLTALHGLIMKQSMLYCFLTNWNDTYNSSQLLIIDTYRNRIINQWYPESMIFLMMCQVYTVYPILMPNAILDHFHSFLRFFFFNSMKIRAFQHLFSRKISNFHQFLNLLQQFLYLWRFGICFPFFCDNMMS